MWWLECVVAWGGLCVIKCWLKSNCMGLYSWWAISWDSGGTRWTLCNEKMVTFVCRTTAWEGGGWVVVTDDEMKTVWRGWGQPFATHSSPCATTISFTTTHKVHLVPLPSFHWPPHTKSTSCYHHHFHWPPHSTSKMRQSRSTAVNWTVAI